MALFFFIISTIFYSLIALKIKQWEVITVLGFQTETPLHYIRKPKLYSLIRTLLLLIAVVSAVLVPYRYSMGITFPILGLLWFSIKNAGINRGINEYRRVMKETREYYESNPKEDGGNFYKAAKESVSLTDDQIYKMYKKNIELYSMLKK